MLKTFALMLALAQLPAALAADIDVALDADSPATLARVTLALAADDTPLTRIGPTRYAFEPDPGLVAERLSVATQGAPAGFTDFALEIDIPFFVKDEPIELAAPVVLTSLPLSKRASIWSLQHLAFTNRLSSLLRVNARSGRAFMTALRFIRDIPRPANAEDGALALLFARTSAALATEHFVQPDPEMEEAVAFIEATLANPDAAARVFPRTQARGEALATVALFKQFRTIQLKKLVDAADQRAGAGGADTAAQRCARIADLTGRFRAARTSSNTPGLLPIELRNLENAAICANDAIRWPAEAPPDDAKARLDAAHALLNLLDDRLEEFAQALGTASGDSATLRRAQARRIELANQYEFVTAAADGTR